MISNINEEQDECLLEKDKFNSETDGLAKITLRPVETGDDEFIFKLFTRSRPDLKWTADFDKKLKAQIYHQQYEAEQTYFQRYYPDAQLNVVLLSGIPVGRIYLHSGNEMFRIITIGILPEYRHRGIGKYLLGTVLKEAYEADKPVRLQVAWHNTYARNFYQRLGFCVVEEAGIYCEMQWMP